MEVWKVLDEFPNYSVSSEGRVRNDYHRRLLKISHTRDGTAKVGLRNVPGRQETRSVRILVAHMFVPGETETYNTPINLDGDLSNNSAMNLMWRPRWFAVKYKMQFRDPTLYKNIGPIVHVESGTTYPTVYDAGIHRGFLFYEIVKSIYNHTHVFPDWDNFTYPPDTNE